MFDLHNERCEAKKGDLLFVGVLVQGEREREKEKERGEGVVSGRVGGRLACLCPGRLV